MKLEIDLSELLEAADKMKSIHLSDAPQEEHFSSQTQAESFASSNKDSKTNREKS